MKKAAAKKITSLLLLLFMLLSAVACASPDVPAETGTETEAVTDDGRIHADLPPTDFEGYTFSMLHWNIPGWTIHGIDLYTEELNSDPINDAVYRRNALISEKYNVVFSYDEEPATDVFDRIRSSISANEDLYDLVYLRLCDMPSLMLEGDFLDIEHDVGYVDLDKPYWDQAVRKEMTFAGRLYLVIGSLNITDKNSTACVVFNKRLAADYGIPDPYQSVRSGSWTLDALTSCMDAVDGDLDGDGKINPENDIVSFLGVHDVAASFFTGGGGRYTVKDEYDYPIPCFNTEETYDLISAILDIMERPDFTNSHMVTYPKDLSVYFAENKGLFCWVRSGDVIGMRGEEGVDFGVLPTPKYDDLQEEYLSAISRHTAGFTSILSVETQPDTVGFILEALTAESHYGLQEAYYDVTLKTKSARDDESQDMLDLIFAHRVVDIAEICDFGAFPSQILYMATGTGRRMASLYSSYEKSLTAAMEDFLDKIDALD
ncbi:MAG: hypothetical protein MJ070_05405 [Lachnospiraceae bacterium]|nr:hypothetical protein [Lachnospiraceae bacterium]